MLPDDTSADSRSIAAAEEVAFLRTRLARFATLAAGIFCVFWLIALGFYVSGDEVDSSIAYDLIWLVLLPALAAAARWRRTSPRVLRFLDAMVMVALGAFWASSAYSSRLDMPMEIPMVFMSTIVVIARVVLVPSSFARSAWIGALTVSPAMVVIGLRGGTFLKGAAGGSPMMFVVFSIAWLSVLAFVSALASQLLFGLERKVREAMRLGQYALERKIGEGATGTVYLARHVLLKRPAAIKVLRSRGAKRDASSFEREIRITSALSHPNTVTLFDFGWTTAGVFYYVMEYLDGLDLEQLVRRYGPQPEWRVIHLLRQACGSLTEAHGRGVLHRDIKPANLIVSERGGVPDYLHVVDFGLASGIAHAKGPTQLGGTAGYIAPEVITKTGSSDARSDVYALGAVAYWLATGTVVFDGVTAADVCIKHATTEPESLSVRVGKALDSAFERLVLECLEKDPADRPASATALLERLDELALALPFRPRESKELWADVHATKARGDRPGTATVEAWPAAG